MPDLRSRINELSALGPDWDSHGAEPIAPGVTVRALTIVELFDEEWSLFPRNDGGVVFERDRDDSEVTVRPDGTYDVTLVGLDGPTARALLKARRG